MRSVVHIQTDHACPGCICHICVELGGAQVSCGQHSFPQGETSFEVAAALLHEDHTRKPGSYRLTATLVAGSESSQQQVIHQDAVTVLIEREDDRREHPDVLANHKSLVASFGIEGAGSGGDGSRQVLRFVG